MNLAVISLYPCFAQCFGSTLNTQYLRDIYFGLSTSLLPFQHISEACQLLVSYANIANSGHNIQDIRYVPITGCCRQVVFKVGSRERPRARARQLQLETSDPQLESRQLGAVLQPADVTASASSHLVTHLLFGFVSIYIIMFAFVQ